MSGKSGSPSSSSNPWNSRVTSSLDTYCEAVLDRVENATVKKIPFDEIVNNKSSIVCKLKKADLIVKDQRKRLLGERLRAVEVDAEVLFKQESMKEVANACRQLVDILKEHHTPENVRSLLKSCGDADCVVLEPENRKLFDACFDAITELADSRFDRSDIKFSIEKLILDAKFRAMNSTIKFNELKKFYEVNGLARVDKDTALVNESIDWIVDTDGDGVDDIDQGYADKVEFKEERPQSEEVNKHANLPRLMARDGKRSSIAM